MPGGLPGQAQRIPAAQLHIAEAHLAVRGEALDQRVDVLRHEQFFDARDEGARFLVSARIAAGFGSQRLDRHVCLLRDSECSDVPQSGAGKRRRERKDSTSGASQRVQK